MEKKNFNTDELIGFSWRANNHCKYECEVVGAYNTDSHCFNTSYGSAEGVVGARQKLFFDNDEDAEAYWNDRHSDKGEYDSFKSKNRGANEYVAIPVKLSNGDILKAWTNSRKFNYETPKKLEQIENDYNNGLWFKRSRNRGFFMEKLNLNEQHIDSTWSVATCVNQIDAKDWYRAKTVSWTRWNSMFRAISDTRKRIGRTLAFYFYYKFVKHEDLPNILKEYLFENNLNEHDTQIYNQLINLSIQDIFNFSSSIRDSAVIDEFTKALNVRTRNRGFFSDDQNESLNESFKDCSNDVIKKVALKYVRENGYMPGSYGYHNNNGTSYRQSPTVDEIYKILNNNNSEDLISYMTADVDLENMNSYAATLIPEGQYADYQRRCLETWRKETLTKDDLKLIVAFCNSFIKNEQYLQRQRQKQEREAQHNAEVNSQSNDYAGQVGDEVTFEVAEAKITGYIQPPSYYADSYPIWTIKSVDGKTFIWSDTKGEANIQPGNKITGKIKSLSEFRGIKQTKLTRIKITQKHGRGFFAEQENENLNEARNIVTDTNIISLVKECIQKLKNAKIMPENWGNDINIEETEATNTFGAMKCKKTENSNFTLYLSKYLFNEEPKKIENTIYHELCHYIQFKQLFDEGILYWSAGRLRATLEYRDSYESAHGGRWKSIAAEVSKISEIPITRTNTYSLHTDVGQKHDDKIKYIVKCKNCGHEFKYIKETKFIKAIENGNGHTEGYWCNCGSHNFEIIKKGE